MINIAQSLRVRTSMISLIAIPGLVQIDDLGRLRQRLDFGAGCRAINLLPLSVCSTLLSVRTVQPFDRK
jgi:hypothetical protein